MILSAYIENQVKKMHHVSYCDSEADASYGNLVAAIGTGFWSLAFVILVKELGKSARYTGTQLI